MHRAKGSKERTFGLETEATFANEISAQCSPSGAVPFEKETSVEDRRSCASRRGEELSSSLLGTWAHFANGSSRSRLCRIAEHDGGLSFGT